MAEISISISELEGAISRLNSLKNAWLGNNTTPPATVGGGKTVTELETMTQLYQEINNRMIVLASNTASFLTNVKDSFQSSDEKAASGITGGK